MKISFSLLFILLIGVSTLYSDSSPSNRVCKSEIFIEVAVKGIEDVDKLISLGLLIEANIVQNHIAKGFISKDKVEDLRKAGFNVTILDENVLTDKDNHERVTFYTFEAVRTQLIEWATVYPDLMILDTLGYSQNGEPIWVFNITGTADTVAKQRVYANGATHGNENIGTEIVMWMAEDLLTNYASDSKIKALVDRTHFTIHPIVNPDGFIKRRRTLENGDDPNRCGGIQLGVKGASYPYEHPELKVYRDVLSQGPVHLGLDYHCGMISMLIPYFASKISLNLDLSEYDQVKQLYPPTYDSQRLNHFETIQRPAAGLTNNAPATKYGTISLMPEVCNHNPSASTIEKIATHNYGRVKDVLSDMQKGIKGIVTDSETNEPLYARVSINGKYAATYSHHKSGGYFKYICRPTGEYEVTAYANGYKSETKTVSSKANGFAECNFKLTKELEQPFAVLSIDALLSYNASLDQDKLYNCLELHDDKTLELIGKNGEEGYIDLDFGPTNFARNGEGDDITVYATGDYTVCAAYNIDYINQYTNVLGHGTGIQSFDLSKADIDSARYIQIRSQGTTKLDAVEAVAHFPTGNVKDVIRNKEQFTKPTISMLKGKKSLLISAFIPKGDYEIVMYTISGKKIADISKGIMVNERVQSFLWNGNTVCAPGMYIVKISHVNGYSAIRTPLVW